MKNEIYTPLIILALTIVFGVICLMVYLSKGNHYWIKKKLKIGALLLGLTLTASSCDLSTDTCYAPTMPDNTVYIDNLKDSSSCFWGDTLFINISEATYNYYSFQLFSNQNLVDSGILESSEPNEFRSKYFPFAIDSTVIKDNYTMYIYGEATETPEYINKLYEFEFVVK